MSLRVGGRVGNSYVSTNGKNVRVTTRVGKHLYIRKQWGHKNNHRKYNLENMITNIILSIILYFTIDLLLRVFGINGILGILSFFFPNINIYLISFIVSITLTPFIFKKYLKLCKKWDEITQDK